MPVLKSLSFTALPKTANDPVQLRRAKFVTRLEEQKLLLKDPNHVRTVQRWAKVDGERQAITKQQAVRPWWKTDLSGQVVMSVKFGARPIEFERGKAGIVVPSKDKLPAVIDTLIAAVRAGELDELFGQAAKAGSIGKPRKVALILTSGCPSGRLQIGRSARFCLLRCKQVRGNSTRRLIHIFFLSLLLLFPNCVAAQNANDMISLFRGLAQTAIVQSTLFEWKKLPKDSWPALTGR